MGDSPTDPVRGGNLSNDSQGIRSSDALPHSIMAEHDSRMGQPQGSSAQLANYSQNQSFSTQYSTPLRTDAFNMGNIGSALPEVQYQGYNNPTEQQHRQQGHNAPNYQMQGMPQFSGQQAQSSPVSNIPYTLPYQNQYPGMYPAHHVTQQVQAVQNSASQFYQGQGYMGQLQPHQQIPAYFVPPGQYGQHGAQVYHSNAVQSGVRGTFSDGRQLSPQVNEFPGSFPRVGVSGRPGGIRNDPHFP